MAAFPPLPPLDDWSKGDKILASHLQQPIAVLKSMAFAAAAAPGAAPPPFREMFPGVVVDKGPNGETLKSVGASGEQYWVQKQYIGGGNPNDPFKFGSDRSDAAINGSAPSIFLVTNLPDWQGKVHSLTTGAQVFVFAWWDEGVVSSSGGSTAAAPQNNVRYLMFCGGGGSPGFYRITGYQSGNGYYNFRPQVRNDTPFNPFVNFDAKDYFDDAPDPAGGPGDSLKYHGVNIAESKGGGHFLRLDGTQYVVGWPAGKDTDGVGVSTPIIACDVEPPKQLYRITGFDSARGYYLLAAQLSNATQPDPTVDLDLTHYYTDGDIVCGLNVAENDRSIGKIHVSSYKKVFVRGWQDGFTSDDSPVPLVYFDRPPQGFIRVSLTKDGGIDGTATAAATYTYTVTDYITGEQYDTGISPAQQRSKGSTLEAKIGTAFFSDHPIVLWWCDEVPNKGPCT